MILKFTYGYGLFDKTLFCGYVSEGLKAYLGNAAKHKLPEIVHPSETDKLFQIIDDVVSGKSSEQIGFFRLINENGDYRYYRVKICPYREETFMFEVIDAENAIENSLIYEKTLNQLEFLAEKQKTIIFAYDYKNDILELFRYEKGEKTSLTSQPVWKEFYEKLRADINDPSLGRVKFQFKNIYTIGGTKYLALGSDIVKNAEKELLVGTVTGCDGEDYLRDNAVDMHDAMTGLYNKPYSLTLARESLSIREKVSIVMMDIDDFKSINDTYGHVFGDEVIKKLAMILREAATNRGFAGRFGGDEFFLCLYDIESEQELRSIMQGIYYHFKRSFPDKDHQFSVTMGIAEYPRNAQNFDVLLKKADRALYIGKFKGKNRYIIYKEFLHGEIDDSESNDISIVKEESSNRQLQLRICKESTVSFVDALKNNKPAKKTLDEVFEKMMRAYKFEEVSIYTGENFESVYRFGKISNPLPNTSYIKIPEVLAQFNDLGLFHTAVKYVRDKYIDEFHGYMASHDIMTSSQIIIGSKDDIRAVITYNTEHDLGSNSVEEMQDLLIVSQLAAELIL